MLKELEKLLAEVAKQQGIDVPARRPPAQRVPDLVEVDEVIEAEPVHEGIEQHVARTVDTTDIIQHTTGLGAEVGQADDRSDARIHDKFDRGLGRLNDNAYVEDSSQSKTASAAGEIAELLRDPKSIQHAIILNEILSRPVDRW